MSIYPFAALVGQDDLRTVLTLNAIYPAIGGVLIRGEKGTAKSTAARGLAAVLPPIQAVAGCPFNCDPTQPWGDCPHCQNTANLQSVSCAVPFVDLPIGATEDRVLGSLDFERALKEGTRAFHPGLLAAAHRGILYIDEVNLLPAHLVDVLLDAAAMGVNTVQREGITIQHPAKFILIGTMNPEEGDLRPQLLDRFGLMVDISAPRDVETRSEVVRRRITFENQPAAFATHWQGAQAELQAQIIAAGARLAAVSLEDDLLNLISHICTEFEVNGLRADITLYKTARALAAWEGRQAVSTEDIRRAAEWVLPHRRRRRPFEDPALDREKLDEVIQNQQQPAGDDAPSDDGEEAGADGEDEGTGEKSGVGSKKQQVFKSNPAQTVKRITVAPEKPSTQPASGRRNPTPTEQRGRYVRAVPTEKPSDLALDATLRAAAVRGLSAEGKPQIQTSDLHQKVRASQRGSLILFIVDSSGSMMARKRMEAVKGTVLSLLLDAYQKRDQVGVIAFRGTVAEVLLPPTNSVELAEKALLTLPTGGRTPLAHALTLAHDILRRVNAELVPLVIILSDGKANVALPDTKGNPWTQTEQAAAALVALKVAALVLDTEMGFVKMRRAQMLAELLGAEYLPLDDLNADALTLTIQQRLSRRS